MIRHFVYVFWIAGGLAIGLFSCSTDSADPIQLETDIPNLDPNDVIKPLPSFTRAEFRTFNLAFWGTEVVHSNRNYNTFQDSIYFTVKGKVDSITLFEVNGVEDLQLFKTDESSVQVNSRVAAPLTLVDWAHGYSNAIQLPYSNLMFSDGAISTPELVVEEAPLKQAIEAYETEFGQSLWSPNPDFYTDRVIVHSRSFYDAKAQFNNGDSMTYHVVLHFVEEE